jgi:hypothetical protein
VPTLRRCLRPVFSRALPLITAPALVAATLTAAAAPAQAAPPAAHRVRAAAPGLLSAGQAMRKARATKRPVTASALTTATSVTVAQPDGRFALTESALPVRARRHGRWEKLNPALHRNRNGTVSPAVTTSGLTLSGGGTGPLAQMTTDARTLSVSWPGGALPTPTLSGATATYSNVYPGVDLAVTANAQGAFSEVFIIKNASAAANPALASLQFTATAPGMTVTADGGGNLRVAPNPKAVPLFTAGTPMAWDSAPLPAGTPTTTNQDGELVEAQSGAPVSSSVTAPGAGAHTATVPVSVSGNTVTLSPPASVLDSSSTVYPAYIDPTWWPAGSTASAWTQVDSGYAGTSYWKESSDLQSGLCDFAGCENVDVARSFLRMPIPSQITSKSVVNAAYLYMTEEWAPSCTTKSVRLYTTGSISSSTTWNNQPSWSSNYSYQDAAFGYDKSCAYYKDDITWTVTDTIQDDVGQQSSQTWGIRAADETDGLAWKQFFSPGHSSDYPHMTVYYNDPPGHPNRTTSPGGSCQYSASTAPVIGNDDVTFYADVSDDDGDNSLTTEFLILNSSGSTVYDSNAQGTSPTDGDNSTAQLTLTRSQMQALQTGGSTTAYTYHWYALVTDNANLTSTMPSDECYFTYNPNGPSQPDVGLPNPASGPLGQAITATFSTPGCGSGSDPCPVSYTYQIGASAPAAPVTAAANGGDTNASITIPRVGPMVLTVYGTASGGNISEAATPQLTGLAPGTPYADGDFDGDGLPDLLTLGTNANDPSLWLAPTDGAGKLGNATDIGGAGTGINGGPGDWVNATVLHGDFTGDKVQDVMAYYGTGPTGNGTNAGLAVVLPGTGDGAALEPANGFQLLPGTFADPVTGDTPFTMVAAGNASETSTGVADLIGIAGDSTNNYSLDLFTAAPDQGPQGYAFGTAQVLSAQSPDNASPSDWKNFSLVTAQPGGNPGATVLFALDNTTGSLYESTNPTESANSVIGSGNWQQITAPWGSAPPALLSGDINSAGQIELWGRSGSTIKSYTLSGTTLSVEHSGSLSQPLNDWPLGDGSGSTAVDTVAGQNATLTGGATWITGDPSAFGTHIRLDGTGYLVPPASAIPSGTSPPKISIWFKTTTPGGVLVSLQASPLSSGPALPGQFDPVLYIGTDGKLYGEWWNGSVDPAVSTTAVDDGIWHHAVLTGGTSSQTLTVDGGAPQTVSGATSFQFTPGNLTFGAGYIGGNWPTEPNYKQSNASDYRYYVNGEIAAITYSYPGGP